MILADHLIAENHFCRMYSNLGIEGTPVNANLLDEACQKLMMSQSDQERQTINEVLTRFSQRSDIPLYIEQILSSNCQINTKFIALNAFTQYINTSWNLLPDDAKSHLKEAMLTLAFKQSNPEILLNRLDFIIVNISKYEYPQVWPSFIDDLLNLASESIECCRNAMLCIEYFSAEISEFAENSLTSARAGEMVNAFEQQLQKVIELVQGSLNSQNEMVVRQALSTLRSLVKWINPNFFFQTDLLNQLCSSFLNNPNYLHLVINILAEIVSQNFIPDEYFPQLGPIFVLIVNGLKPVLEDPDADQQSAFNLLANTMTSFLDQYYEVVEKAEFSDSVLQIHQWLITLTGMTEDDLESCVDYWRSLTQRVYSEFNDKDSQLISFYLPLFPSLRRVLMRRIVAPFEFQNIEEEDGFKARRIVSKSNFGDLFSTIKDSLVFLTHLGQRDTIAALEEMQNEVQNNFSPETICLACWSFGAVVGALNEQIHRLFVNNFLTFFLQLYQQQESIDAKACIAKAACFSFWQANKFLLRDDQLLQGIISWIFDLLQFPEDDTKSVAIECLKSLCKTNADQLIAKKNGGMSVLEHILSNYGTISSSLSESSLFSCFELTGFLIKSVNNNDVRQQMFTITAHFLEQPLNRIIPLETTNPQACHSFTLIMECNTTMAIALGDFYIKYFMTKVDMLMQTFMNLTQSIVQVSQSMGSNQIQQGTVTINAMRKAADSIINLLDKTLNYCFSREITVNSLFPLCMTTVLNSFESTPDIAKSSKVLLLFGTLVVKCKNEFVQNYSEIFAKLFFPTYSLLKQDFTSHENLRNDFFIFLLSIVRSCTDLVISFPQEQLEVFMEAMEFGIRHTQADISIRGHTILKEFIENIKIKGTAEVVTQFTHAYGPKLLILAFSILTDTSHKFAFSLQVSLIKALLSLPQMVEMAGVLLQNLIELFNNQPPEMLQNLLGSLFMSLNQSGNKINDILKDFLISVKHLLPQDPDLVASQKEEALKKMQELSQNIAGLTPQTGSIGYPDYL